MPFWVTVSVRPAIVRVPVRCVVAVFAATVTATVPLPLPDAPEVIVSHDALLVAVQPHPPATVTVTDSGSPDAGEVRTVGAIVYEHGVTPAWVTVNGWFAIVSVAERDVVAVFALALNATGPVPLPLAPDVIVSQPAGLVAFQVQPAAAVTVTDPVEAEAASEALVPDNVGAHVGVYEKRFDTVLGATPPGPLAATRASYSCPGVSGEERRDTKFTRI
jgi:hypothetical protein